MSISTREMWQVNKYLWLCLLFVLVYLHLAEAAGRLSIPILQAYGLFGLAIANGGARTYFGWRQGGFNDRRGWIFTFVDVALISVAIRVTGGIESDIWLLYFVLVISEGLFSSSSQTSLLCTFMVAGYAAATWPDRSDVGYWPAVTTRMFFLVTVASFGLRLSGDRERRSRELARLHEQVTASEERARIAREIHDSLGHALVATILRLELASRLVRRSPEETETILREEVPALRAAWNEGRNLAFHLRPWEPDQAGFIAGLRKHIARFSERTGLSVDLHISDSPWQISNEREICIARVLQEALTNVTKHSQADHVRIELDEQGGAIRIQVDDDGVGLDPSIAEAGFGIRAMRERVEEQGGSFALAGLPERGVRLEAHLPVTGKGAK